MIAATLQHESISTFKTSKPAHARINYGRWLADCPECRGDLNGAEFVTEGEDMTCASCGAVSKVVWPDNIEEIEAVLNKRPRPANRNWEPGETVDMLRLQGR